MCFSCGHPREWSEPIEKSLRTNDQMTGNPWCRPAYLEFVLYFQAHFTSAQHGNRKKRFIFIASLFPHKFQLYDVRTLTGIVLWKQIVRYINFYKYANAGLASVSACVTYKVLKTTQCMFMQMLALFLAGNINFAHYLQELERIKLQITNSS